MSYDHSEEAIQLFFHQFITSEQQQGQPYVTEYLPQRHLAHRKLFIAKLQGY